VVGAQGVLMKITAKIMKFSRPLQRYYGDHRILQQLTDRNASWMLLM
jgi:hypothetical protein